MDVRIDDRGKYFTQRISKESVVSVIRTIEHIVVGHVYVRPEHRLKDELNSEAGRFLAVTNAQVYDNQGTNLLFESSFLLLSYDHVIMISPLEAVSNAGEALWAQTELQEAE